MKDIPELKQEKNFLGKISSLLIDRYRVVYLFIALIVIMGLYSYNELPTESFPDIEINYVFVITAYPGASVQDVENLVTNEVEKAVDGVEDIKSVTSTTNAGYSQVIIEFDENADMKQAKLDVQTTVNDIRFSEGVMDPSVIQMETGEIPIMSFTLTGDYDLVEINDYAKLIQSKFESVEGVKNVDIAGGKEREIRVSIDQNLLYEYGLSTSALSNALAGSNVQLPLGDADLDHVNYSLRVDESFKSLDELNNIVVASSSRGTILLSDVATITDSFKEPDSKAYTYTTAYSDEQVATPVITMSLYRETGADIIGISDKIKDVISEEKGFLYPEDLSIIITADDSIDVSDSLNTVLTSALGGLLVVVAVLFVFIGLNESLIVALVIPLSLLITTSVMNLTGITLNSISLVAFVVALGLLVDNAIVVMENIDRFRDEGLDRITASKIGSNQVAPAVMAATVTTVGAFLPLALMGGMTGQFISILPKTLIITILASFVVSIAVTPNLSSRLLSKYKKSEQKHTKFRDLTSILFVMLLTFIAFLDNWTMTPWTIGLSIAFSGIMIIKIIFRNKKNNNKDKHATIDGYVKWLQKFLDSKLKRWSVFLISFVVLVLSIATIPLGILDFEFLPEEEPNAATITVNAPEGYLLDDTYQITQFVEEELYKIEDLESFDIVVGGNKKNEAKITVNFVDSELRSKSGTVIVDDLRNMVKTIPGAEFDVDEISAMMGPGMGSADAISVGVMGSDFNTLNAVAQQYLTILNGIDGVDSPSLSSKNGVKEITIEFDKNKAAYYNLNISSMAGELRQRISGASIGSYKEAGDSYDITLYYDVKPIESIDEFHNIYFTNNLGQKVPFDEVASLTHSEGMATIDHDNGQKVVKVTANVKNGYNATTVGKVFNDTIDKITLPAGVEISTGGEFQDTQEQIDQMIVAFIIAIFIVYTTLVIQFNSFQQPLVILMSVPFALIGIIIGLILTGNNLGTYAMMGIVALVGIAVNDAIVLVDFANYERKTGKSIREAISEAVKVRFLPVIATSLTTMGGILPLALYNDTFSQLGYAIVFGLFASTVLTLLIIPLMYFMMEASSEKRAHKRKTKRLAKESEVTANV
ncbi:MAG: efflux RND transporter permease subunit [Clostridiales bacterium]|nr:efflux RND transporter permease subunit [Clostridiales bacterium]